MSHISRFIRTHVVHTIVAAMVVVGLAAGGVAYAVSSSGDSSHSTSSPPTTSAPAATPKASAKKGQKAVKGTLTAITAGSWTVQTADGQTMTVTVNAQTKFGSKKTPSSPSAFAVGSHIVVRGTRTGQTIVATKIVMAPAAAPASGASTTTTAPPAG